MKKLYFSKLIVLLAIFAMFSSCKKEEGYGGNSTIVGKLKVKSYNDDYSILKEERYLANTYVYVIFGNNLSYGNRVKTSYDGSFEFKYLEPGDYTVYAYSDDTTMNSSEPIAITKKASISKREAFDIGEIVVADNNPQKIGSITGKVKMNNTSTGDSYYEPDEKVYIVYDNDINYKKYVRTNYNGEYQFLSLPVGHYKLYVYSKDVNNTWPNTVIPIVVETDITKENKNITLSDIEVYK